MIYVVGGRGFVGSAFVRLFGELGLDHLVVTRENASEVAGTECSLLVNANGNSKKYIATREPLRDFDESVRSVAESVSSIRADRYVFLSSGDVYPDPSSPETSREGEGIDPSRQNRYGLHKHLAEHIVRNACADWLIFRLSGFCGLGLRKNPIFDMLHGDIVRLSPESEMQFIRTDNAARLMWDVISSGVSRQIVNVGARSVIRLRNIHDRIGSASKFAEDAPRIRYEISVDLLESLVGRAVPDTRSEVYAFLDGLVSH
jgi:nucleoside-diphosphate-sugar epimerase